MQSFHDKHLKNKQQEKLNIFDIGSTDICGCYKPIFNNPSWKYTGVDLAKGPNVDVVLSKPYDWVEIKSNSVDVLISGQVLEHVEFFWRFYPDGMRALARFGRLTCIEAFTHWGVIGDPGSDPWHDSVLVVQKPLRPFHKHVGVRVMQSLQKNVIGWRLLDAAETHA